MKSPLTGKEMKHGYEPAVWTFRGTEYAYIREFWECEDTHERFTTTESDTAGLNQVTNQYRSSHGIPYTDEIINLRKRYGVSAVMMSRILGIGDNQYRYYENGDVPSESNGKLIRSVFNPNVMLELVLGSKDVIGEKEYKKLVARIGEIAERSQQDKKALAELQRLYTAQRGAATGFAPQSLDRLKNILLYILERCGDTWITKMNKLLFYADFVSYRDYGMAITGLPYRALDFGPVPETWSKVYSEFDEVGQELISSPHFEGVILRGETRSDVSVFTESELDVLNRVCDKLGKLSSGEISKLSHQEDAWINFHEGHHPINFDAAFSLRAL